jgi:hypothetical protein
MKNPWIKKSVMVLLTIAFVGGSGALLAKERKGAQLIIDLKDGRQAAGELVAVGGTSLLLLNAQGKDESIDVAEISRLLVVRKSKAKTGAITGFIVGGLIGGIIGAQAAEQDNASQGSGFLIFGGISGAIFGGIGYGVGSMLGHDKTLELAGSTAAEIEKSLEKLRRYARVRGS